MERREERKKNQQKERKKRRPQKGKTYCYTVFAVKSLQFLRKIYKKVTYQL